ncbi:MAG TPA: hypothetical protein VK137_12765, partial [Planctomycetaceae bacterium]|nr:hypothetical protein [Planctomycetaceae bacterium]
MWWLWNAVGHEPVDRAADYLMALPIRHWLSQAALRGPLDFLEHHAEELLASPHVCPEFSEGLAARRRWARYTPQDLWEDLHDMVRKWDAHENASWLECFVPHSVDVDDETSHELAEDDDHLDSIPIPRIRLAH